MPTTRRISIAVTFALGILWLVVCLLLALFISGTPGTKHGPDAYPGSQPWALGITEVVAAGIQVFLMLVLGRQCVRERTTTLRRRPPSNQRNRFG